ncbi:MAG: hypothetical protein K9N51_03430 [Candidatus Pacebacteria bacterium]|nr:hypothetical protein [Candidatus Paceibacterota bacterium]
MRVLCDTSSVLMLLRIAPDIFRDPRYGCVMVQTVYEEITQKQKFNHKYPWRREYRKCLKSITPGELKRRGYGRTFQVVRALNETTLNEKTDRPYGLSGADQRIAAAVVSLECEVTTGDINLAAFLEQQFDTRNYSPLELVNEWLEAELIEWNEARHEVITDWITQNEAPQPKAQIQRFERLVGRNYPG